tara:strand:+ start:562 stop:1128 length:567 start_codon:yes stop_codon:yes gene_type:complete
MKPGDRPAFSAKFLTDKDGPNKPKLMAAIKKVAEAKWGKNWKKVYAELKSKDRIFLTNGDDKTDDSGETLEGYGGQLVVGSRSYVRPTVVDRNPKNRLTEEDGKIYSGCFVNAFVAIWAQTGEYGKRINCQLQGIQFDGDGDAFGGGKAADPSVFDSLADEFNDSNEVEEFDGEEFDAGDDFDDDIPY